MISLGLATYNGEKFIIDQLASLVKQTKMPDEVIIIDDCSSDSTVSLIKKFISEHKLTNWKLVTNSINLGYEKNFRKLIQLLSGDIIFLCDQDDIWLPNRIEECSTILRENENISLLSCSFNIINSKNKKIEIPQRSGYSNNNLIKYPIRKNKIEKIDFKYLYMHENYAQGCCMCVRREIVDTYLKMNKTNIIHDLALNLIASIENRSYFYNKPLINYRIHENNAVGYDTHKKNVRSKIDLKKRANIFDIQYKFVKQTFEFLNSNYASKKDEINFLVKKINYYEDRKYYILNRNILKLIKLNKLHKGMSYFNKKLLLSDLIIIIISFFIRSN